jgi:uncharacterized protein involved in exopolysaccharide biosynthesis
MNNPIPQPHHDDGQLFDVEQAKLWVGFIARSALRHKIRFLTAAGLVFLATLGAFLSTQKRFAADTVFVAQPDRTPTVTNPGVAIDKDITNPTLNVEGFVKSEANLRRLITETQATSTWEANEAPLARLLRTSVFERIGGPMSDADREAAALRSLRQNLSVDVEDDTITISLVWPDEAKAIQLVNQARENFLEDRRQAELGQFENALEIVQAEATQTDQIVTQLRERLGIPETSQTPLPDASPLKTPLLLQANLAERLTNAKIALQTAEASFSGRYKLVTAADPPLQSVSGRFKILMFGFIAALLAGFIAACLRDIIRGRIMEPWQVVRQCNLPILTSVQR